MMRVFFAFALALITQLAFAQAPTAEQMIEQLKVKPESAAKPSTIGRTRSLGGTRNLTVEAVNPQGTQNAQGATPQADAPAEPQAPAERPSLSLLIQFDFNSATIRAESQQALTNLASALQSKELQEAKFAVEGHTDAKGRAEYNQRLSQLRADAVRHFLMVKGIDSARLMAQGKGSTELSNKDDPNAAENRRVKIVNLQ
jgi:outer membrane protein OmpA-like peptidoglycan-associated protein